MMLPSGRDERIPVPNYGGRIYVWLPGHGYALLNDVEVRQTTIQAQELYESMVAEVGSVDPSPDVIDSTAKLIK